VDAGMSLIERCTGALSFFQKELQLKEKSYSVVDLSLAVTYNNIDTVYHKVRNSNSTRLSYQKTQEIRSKTRSATNRSSVINYNNMAVVYDMKACKIIH
jgi:flagellar biosynthesis chaperone FliJ